MLNYLMENGTELEKFTITTGRGGIPRCKRFILMPQLVANAVDQKRIGSSAFQKFPPARLSLAPDSLSSNVPLDPPSSA